jgi:ribonuclease HI
VAIKGQTQRKGALAEGCSLNRLIETEIMKKNKVTIHIGSSNPANNEGLSGISIAIGHNSDITVHSMVVPETSANRLAIRAITESLKLLNGPSNVTVYSDSQYAIYGASGRNKRKMNLDLWKELDKAAKPHNLTFQWMPQHKDDWIKHCKVTARMTAKAGTKPPKNLGSYWASQTGGLGSNCHSFQAISSKIMSPFLRYTRKEIREPIQAELFIEDTNIVKSLTMNSLQKATIWTDGACLTNPGGPSRIGAVIQQDGKRFEISKDYPVAMDGEPRVTNNRLSSSSQDA